MSFFSSYTRDQSGGPAAEFAMVLPLFFLFIFGIIDVGRFMWEYNLAEKATQMGARYAVVTDIVPIGLQDYSFAVSCAVPQGDVVEQGQFPGVSCEGGGTAASPTASCSLKASSSCSPAFPTTSNPAALGNITARMRAFKSDITPANVTIDYLNAGLGYAGDPNGLDIAPLVTVKVTGLNFTPITTQIFGAPTVTMPDFSYSLTMEDGLGNISN
jgi:hypothetical protein